MSVRRPRPTTSIFVGYTPAAATRAIRINRRFDRGGFYADSPLTGVSMMAIWVTTVLHRRAPPSYSGGSRNLISKDFCAVEDR
jgi:hypothetical protein